MPIRPKQQPPYYQETGKIKEYIALMNQTGTNAPTAIILVNTIGNIIWTYDNVGNYTGTLANTFPLNKTTFETIPNGAFQIAMGSNEDGEPSNSIYLQTMALPAATQQDGVLYYTTIKITIYV